MTRRNAVAAKLQCPSQERSQTALRNHGSTRLLYMLKLRLSGSAWRLVSSVLLIAVAAVPNFPLPPTSELPPLTLEART